MSALTWKPGPPPLDVPGRYDCRFAWARRHRAIVNVLADGDWVTDDAVPYERDEAVKDITHHFGPIPSPPNGETT